MTLETRRLRLPMTPTSKAIAAFALVILLCIGVLAFLSIVRDEEDRAWVTHTHLVLEKLQAIRIDITDAETGQRGYILTGQDFYLAPYKAGANQVREDIKDLRNLTSDNPKQQEAVNRLESLVVTRLDSLAQRLEIRKRNGLVVAAASVLAGNSGAELMDEIRGCLAGMGQTEEELLAQRLRTAAVSNRTVKVVIVLGNILAFLILLVAGLIIHREAIRRMLAERGLNDTNRRLEQRTAELSDANGEMESFSYSVAHDLRAPLRQIAGYSNVVLQGYGQNLDAEGHRYLHAEGHRYLQKIDEGAQKMGRLVDDLLSLSKIGRQEPSLQSTSLDNVLRQVVDELMPECSGRQVDWQIGQLFNTDCDPGLMKQVFVNLLSNAVKYTRKKDRAVIQIGETRQNGQRVIFVRDNGAGFEMQYVGKLFGVFQRLHKTRDFEGTGVGLAIVQRIIRKHGGRIWAEAELGRGATFYFTLESPEINPSNKSELLFKKDEVTYVA